MAAYEQPQANAFCYDIPNDSATIFDSHNSAYFDDKVGQRATVQQPSTISNVDMMPPQRGHAHAHAHAHFRKDSFNNNSAGVLSPTETSHWDQKPYTTAFDHANALSASGYQQDNTAFVRPDPVHFFNNGNPYMSWAFEHSGTNTPTGTEVFVPHKFEASPYPQQAPEQTQHRPSTSSSVRPDPSSASAPQVHTPVSPQSHSEWMAFATQEMEGRQTMPKRLRPNSSPRLDSLEHKGDGIRKKNARIDIPSDRNLESIERLLGETTNEDERKELKSQKRLLRNREAALASRQRKKKHTEDLEVKEKSLQQHLQSVEHQLTDLQVRIELQEKERQFLQRRLQEASVTIESLRQEKETSIINHTQETGMLRQKINYLTEQLESGPAPAMSAAPSSTGFTDFNSELDNLHLGAHDWPSDDYVPGWDLLAGAGTFSMEPAKPISTMQTEMTKQSNDPPIASGILFMLLLCGAFVTSKSSSGAPAIPHMPDEVKAASSTVLNSLLKNAGSDPFTDYANQPLGLHPPTEPVPSSTSWPGTSHLSSLHRHLTTPTKSQEAEQIFSLTPAQYNSLTGESSSSNVAQRTAMVPPPTGNSRKLGLMLQNLREESIAKGGAAEVYTRSLLWDQVPEDVVREFKKRVHESEKSTTGSGPQPSNNNKSSASTQENMFGYEIELAEL
ncbi:hypothetical protein MBLNU459_g3022t1 [Dothideomycetes sp. NU459]